MQNIFHAVDWFSVKFTLATTPFLFIGSVSIQVLGVIAVCSTIVYNCIRIYKELKRKKDNESSKN